jgi:ABC-2 type transport system ATP-binding protein
MDEAEYCSQVGIMSSGQLLAMDSPSTLKRDALPGLAWDVYAEELLPTLLVLENSAGVLRAGLSEDHIRVITEPGIKRQDLSNALISLGANFIRIQQAEPTLEDVFLALASDE